MTEVNTVSLSGETLLQGAIDALPGNVAILGGDGEILMVNHAWREFARNNAFQDETFCIGTNYLRVCVACGESETGAAQAARWLSEVLEGTRESFDLEYPCHSPTEKRWFNMRASRIGEVENSRAIVIHENITPRKLTENALRDSEESYRTLAQTASDVILKIDENSRILFINPACERVFGYQPSELIGQPLATLIPENLRLRHERILNGYLNGVRRNISGQNMEVPALHKDGRIFPLEVSFGEFAQEKSRFFIAIARDISGRKQTEQLTAHLASIVKSSDDAIISKDMNGIITSWNLGAEKIYGYRAEEVVGKPLNLLIPPYLRDEEPLILSRIRRGEKIDHYETLRRRKDGTDINISLTVSPIQDERGSTVGASKIARDISERIKTEEALRENQMMLALAMQSSRMGVWEQDLASDVVIWSAELETIFGLEKGAFKQNSDAFYALLYEDDRERIRHEVQRAIKEHRDYIIEFRFHHGGGGIRWMEGRGQAVYSEKGEPVRLYGIGIDITDRIQAQEALLKAERRAAEDYLALLSRIVSLAQVLGTARDLITIYRTVAGFIRASMPCSAFFISFYNAEKSLRIAAYVSGEKGEVDISSLPPMKLTEDGGPNSQAIFQKKSVVINHYMDLMKNRPHVIMNEDGNDPHSSLVVPMVFMNRIIGTFEVQAYEESAFTHEHIVALEMVANLAAVAIENVRLLEIEAHAREAAEAANRAKDEFLSVLSHELRTPLNAILGWTRMMKSGTLDQERKTQAIDTIERNARLQNNLIEDLLDVSRIISGKMRIEKGEVDIVSIVKASVETAKPSAQEKNIELSFQTQMDSQNILGDATRLQQIINNLLSNAIKFTPSGGAVFITLKRSGEKIRIKVSDTGIGVSKELLPMIFDRFKQADSTTRRAHSGLGLGLTIVRHLTELHGGRVEASSEGEHFGSTFEIELPIILNPRESTEFAVTNGDTGNNAKIKSAKILLVDDDREGIQPLQLLLENNSAEVFYADSAAKALKNIASERFDLLVSDIGMPEMDGFELIGEVRKLTARQNYFLPAIALTAYAATQDRERALSAGYQTHISKPVDFEKFLSVVNKLLNNHQA